MARPVDDSLGVVLSRFCMAQCEHCGSSARPDRTERLDRTTLDRTLRSVAAGGHAGVVFTGGEPMAHRSLALHAVGLAHHLGLKTTVCSNAFWAGDDRRSTTTLDQLAAAGLDRLHLSTDRWHLDFVPVDNVVRAAAHAVERDLEVQVAIPAGRADWTALDLISRFGHLPDVTVFSHPAHPVGRGETLPLSSLMPTPPRLEGCHLAGHHEIDVDGRISICPTSADFGPGSVLRAGDATVDDASQVVERSRARALPHVIARWGPVGVAKLAGWTEGEIGRFAHDCHLCRALHEDRSASDAIQDRHGLDLLAPSSDEALDATMALVDDLVLESEVSIRC